MRAYAFSRFLCLAHAFIHHISATIATIAILKLTHIP
jgi:hypothetical protein